MNIRNYLKLNLALFLGFSLLMTACKKQELDVIEEEIIEETESINFSLSGLVLDVDGRPVDNVLVTIDAHSAFTNKDGIYTFRNIDAQGPRARVHFTHGQYFKMYKTPEVKANTFMQLDVHLTPLINPDIISAGTGGLITNTEGVEINFLPNAFIQEDGSDYTGEVRVYTTFLDPTAANINTIFPADFEVLNEENIKQLMQIFSGIGVELYDNNGAPLALKKAATISLPVPDALLNDAPSTVKLGHFDETLGIWKVESEARLEGNHYAAEVEHFSYWCALVLNDGVYLNGFILEDLGQQTALPINDLFVKVSVANTGIAGYTRTRSNGSFDLKVPAGLELKIEFFANSFNTTCGAAVHSQTIPPLTQWESLGNIFIDSPELITVTGTVADCDETLLTEGYVVFENQAGNIRVAYIQADGTFSLPLYSCNDQINITSYNADFSFQSEAYFLSNTEEDVLLGTILACEVVNVPPYLLKVVTGGDTIIYSTASGIVNNQYDGNNNLSSLVVQGVKADIKNTSRPLNEGSGIILINISGVEDENCSVIHSDIVIPLKDQENDSYKIQANSYNTYVDQPSIGIYNCSDEPNYLHFVMTGFLEQSPGVPTSHRDSIAHVDIYFPL